MPPKAKINKEMILDAAVAIVREQGHEMINARTIAERLLYPACPVSLQDDRRDTRGGI